jgi:hypothetical protein
MRGRRIAWLAVLTLLAGLAGLAGPAAAQRPGDATDAGQGAPRAAPDPAGPPAPAAPVKDPKLAKKWLAAGQQLVQKGDWQTSAKRTDDAKASYTNAVIAFEKSIEAGDDLNTYALLADAEEKLGKIDLAAKHYRTVVKAQAGVRPDVLKKATARFDDLSTKIGIVTLTVLPEGTAISLSGNELGKAPLSEPLILMPGTYTMSFQADGYQPRETEIKVEAGSEAERNIQLEEVKVIVHAPPPPEPPPQPPPPPSPIPLYAGAGATAVLLGTATVTGILAIGRHDTYVARDSTARERADAKSSGQALALVTDVALASGLVAGGFTAYWYLVKYKPVQQKRMEQRPAATSARAGWRDGAQSTKVELIPWVQRDASGLTLVGAF